MAFPKPYDFKPGDTVVFNGKNGWSFTKYGEELVIHTVRENGAIGILAKDHADKRAIVDNNENFVWWYSPESFYPSPGEKKKIKISLDSVFK